MTSEGYDEIYKNVVLGNQEVIPTEKAEKWIFDNTLGRITKQKLDLCRQKEVNRIDLMMSTLIIYHVESLIEMQIMACTICMIF
jgi:hypothetical protein